MAEATSSENPDLTFKKIAFHVHFLSTTFVIGMHLINPPSMDVWTLFGIIGVTLALAVLLPPRGMLSAEVLVPPKQQSENAPTPSSAEKNIKNEKTKKDD